MHAYSMYSAILHVQLYTHDFYIRGYLDNHAWYPTITMIVTMETKVLRVLL